MTMAEQGEVEEKKIVQSLTQEAVAEVRERYNEVFAEYPADALKKRVREERQPPPQADGGEDAEAPPPEDMTLVYSEVGLECLHAVFDKVKRDVCPLYEQDGFFLDLGSGAGKAVIAAGLLHPFEKVVGIEKMGCLCEAGTAAAEKFNTVMPEEAYKPTVQLVKGDFVAEYEAKVEPIAPYVNVALAAATFYGTEQLEAMAKLAQAMPGGSVFITFGQKLPERLLIDLGKNPKRRYNVAAKKALSVRGKSPDGIEIVPGPPENDPNGWFLVHTEEFEIVPESMCEKTVKSTCFIFKKIAPFFPFLQAASETAKFEFDLKNAGERLCASLFVKVALGEDITSLVELGYTPPEDAPGDTVDFEAGVPTNWADAEALPKSGIFKGEYRCDNEKRNFQLRTELLKEYGDQKGTGAWKGADWVAAPVAT